ncbi:hypothetical protein ACFXO9_26655 [Nocardia tengchongensis]|uniref:hypothetical protein n=1 Tax=Nocardia tengchongensis TaxID=2055889 RepID=UPI0036BC6AF1
MPERRLFVGGRAGSGHQLACPFDSDLEEFGEFLVGVHMRAHYRRRRGLHPFVRGDLGGRAPVHRVDLLSQRRRLTVALLLDTNDRVPRAQIVPHRIGDCLFAFSGGGTAFEAALT